MSKPKPLGKPVKGLPIYDPDAINSGHSRPVGGRIYTGGDGPLSRQRDARVAERIARADNVIDTSAADWDDYDSDYANDRDNPRRAVRATRPRFTEEQLRWAEEAADPDFDERVERGHSNLRRAEAASRRSNERFHARLTAEGRSRYNTDVSAVRDSIRAQQAVRSNAGLFGRTRGIINRGVEAGFDVVKSTHAGRAIGELTSKFGRTAVGKVAGAVAAKTAVPLMVADAAYNTARIIHAGYGAAAAQNEARKNEADMTKRYGTVEAATATRHARNKK